MTQTFTAVPLPSTPLPPVPLPPGLAGEIAEIRQRSTALGWASETTSTYQDAVLEMVARTHDHPGPVLELGVYHGGLSVQLAHLLRVQGRRLICLDISHTMLDITRKHFQTLGLPTDHVAFFAGTGDDFYDSRERPSAVIIDADHSYNAARHDLACVLTHNGDTRAILLHDYCLRVDYVKDPTCTKDYVQVARAVHDICGDDPSLLPIGEEGRGQYMGEAASYVETGVSEGMVIFPECLPSETFARAAAHVACAEALRGRRLLSRMAQNVALMPKVLAASEAMLSVQADMLKMLARMRTGA